MRIINSFLLVILFALLTGCSSISLPIPTPETIPEAKPLKDIKIALVLGGGGSRGVAHAGVISVLEEHDIPIDLIVGTSIGSVVGALYADEPNSEKLKQKMFQVKANQILCWNVYSGMRMFWDISGLDNGYGLRKYLLHHLKARDFNQLSIPLATISTDIEQGEKVVLRSGPIIPAVHASSAIPLIFTPVRIYHRLLVDGGVVSPVPVETAKALGAKKIIAVDIGAVLKPQKIRNTYDIADRSLWLSYINLTKWEVQKADVLIQPHFDSTDLFNDKMSEVYFKAGQKAALNMLPQLKQLKNDES